MNARAAMALLPLSLAVASAGAQRCGMGSPFPGGPYGESIGDPNEFYKPREWAGNVKYDGRITFARVMYRGYGQYSNREGPGWLHDYPRAESHFMRIMSTITTMRPFIQNGPKIGSNLLSLEDPELFKYPVAYLSEPVGWHPTNGEVLALRKFLEKGGFMMFDDFRFNSPDIAWSDFVQTFRRVMPNAKIMPIPAAHPVFDSFFKIDLGQLQNGCWSAEAQYFGVFKDNDPKKRLMAVINFDADIGEYWQWSDRGFNVVPSNEAYKLGVNYFIYALTH
jgi:hypothetical protein